MEPAGHPFARARLERVIALVRVVLALAGLVAVWADVDGPARSLTNSLPLHAGFLGYALLLLLAGWLFDLNARWLTAVQVADVAIIFTLQAVTGGPSSRFFTYFVFALFVAALRWGWRATVQTSAVVLAFYLLLGVWFSRVVAPSEFELDRFITRSAYLLVVTVVLVLLGRHEAQLREEVRQLARWPRITAGDWRGLVPQLLDHARGIIGAKSVTLLWSVDDEPWLQVSTRPFAGSDLIRHPPTDFEPAVKEGLDECVFVTADPPQATAQCLATRGGVPFKWQGVPIHDNLIPRLSGHSLLSAPFHTERVSGRIFFVDPVVATADMLPLAEVVGREIGASLDQLQSFDRSQRLAVAEDRIRVARDLHDGVLQALTGVRLELQGIAASATGGTSVLPSRLYAVERALAMEQRDLRRFIDQLKPEAAEPLPNSLAERLDEVRRRMALEWHAPVTVDIRPKTLAVNPALDNAVSLMVQEAVANAMKHGHPSRVSVVITAGDDSLHVTVHDDGRGFGFAGRLEHADLVASNRGPASLRDRVASLGGQMAIESTPTGSQVELSLPLHLTHA